CPTRSRRSWPPSPATRAASATTPSWWPSCCGGAWPRPARRSASPTPRAFAACGSPDRRTPPAARSAAAVAGAGLPVLDRAPLAHGPQRQHRHHRDACGPDDGAGQAGGPGGEPAVAVALQVDERPADQAAAQAADEDGRERQDAGRQGGHGGRRVVVAGRALGAGGAVGGGLGHGAAIVGVAAPARELDGRPSRAHRCQTGPMREWLVGGGLILGRDGLLLVRNRRRNGDHDWSPPGGVIDEGESLLDGLTREVREETGVVVTRWRGPVYRVEVLDPDLRWHLRVGAHEAAEYGGEVLVDDPDGIVVESAYVDPAACADPLAGCHPWVVVPLGAWLAARWQEPRTFRYLVRGVDASQAVVTRRCRCPPVAVARSCTSTWTPSSSRSSCCAGPGCGAGRSSSAAPATGASSPPPATRPAPTACTRPCPPPGPAGSARTPSSSPATTRTTPPSAGGSWRCSAPTRRWSSRSASTRRSWTSPGPVGSTATASGSPGPSGPRCSSARGCTARWAWRPPSSWPSWPPRRPSPGRGAAGRSRGSACGWCARRRCGTSCARCRPGRCG